MKRFLLFAVSLCITALCFADPAEGYWLSLDSKTNKPNAGWYVYVKDSVLYGKMLSSPGSAKDKVASNCKSSYKNYPLSGDVSKMKIFNEVLWVYGLKMSKTGVWDGGTIIDPQSKNGASYSCTITFHAADGKKYKVDTLEVYGGLGPVGRTSIWQRTDEATASAMW
ncbi:MAG: DUF2147 domain-containing protein [Spirochaetaceae bacterium]|jgi:hypothetical protein|nr:DUF2147 domain-containing protein [Spirochaetaceae bacterium]